MISFVRKFWKWNCWRERAPRNKNTRRSPHARNVFLSLRRRAYIVARTSLILYGARWTEWAKKGAGRILWRYKRAYTMRRSAQLCSVRYSAEMSKGVLRLRNEPSLLASSLLVSYNALGFRYLASSTSSSPSQRIRSCALAGDVGWLPVQNSRIQVSRGVETHFTSRASLWLRCTNYAARVIKSRDTLEGYTEKILYQGLLVTVAVDHQDT